MSKNDEIIAKFLFEKFEKVALNEIETAKILGISVKALQKDRANAEGIPFTRRSTKERSQVIYNISTIAKVLSDNESKVF